MPAVTDAPEETRRYYEAAAARACSDTEAGWVWYCDQHETHGNADSREEAEHIALAHQEFQAPEDDPTSFENCDVWIVPVDKAAAS